MASSGGLESADDAHWSVTPMWVEPTTTTAAARTGDVEDRSNNGESIYVSGVHTSNSGAAAASGAAVAAKEEEGQRRRAFAGPPPPVTFYDYYTWRVDSN